MFAWRGLAWASAFCCRSTTILFSIQGCIIQAGLGAGYILAARTRGKELKRIRDAEANGNTLAFLYPNVNDLESSVQAKLPRVAVVMPVKGCGVHSLGNWRSQVLSMYGGELEFLFVVESREDPAYIAVSQLLQELKGQILGRVIVAGLSTSCSQKIHNQLAGVDSMHQDTKYVLFLDDDVRIHPGTIGACVAHMNENPKIFVLTGYPFDVPSTKTLGSYCIYEYHMPCSLGFGISGGQTFFLWGGFMMMHAEDFRCNRYGMVTGLRDGGYSDDMTLSSVASGNGRIISSPPMAVFTHPLAHTTFSQYWNYLLKQTIVLETYITPVNYLMNRALFYIHCWLSWSFCIPYATSLVHLMVVLEYCWSSNVEFTSEVKTGLVVIGCTICSSLFEILSMRHLSYVEIDLCNALSPESDRVSTELYNWFLVFFATIVDNFMYTVSALTSTFTQHINWSGVDYYFHNGKVCQIERRKDKGVKTKSGFQDSELLQTQIFRRSIKNVAGAN